MQELPGMSTSTPTLQCNQCEQAFNASGCVLGDDPGGCGKDIDTDAKADAAAALAS